MTKKQQRKQLLLDEVWVGCATNIAKLSHCAKTKVAAIAVRDNRILMSGINGTPEGHENCDDIHIGEFDHLAHRAWADDHEIHAEMNVVNFSSKEGVSLKGATLYCTMHPCKQCAKNLAAVGIKRIVYRDHYDRISQDEHDQIVSYLKKSNISLEHFKGENE